MNKKILKKGFLILSTAIVISSPLLALTSIQNNANKIEKVIKIKDSEEQKESFKEIDMDDIKNYLSENNVIEDVISRGGRSLRNSSPEIVQEELIYHIEAVKNGEILISDLEDKMIQNIHENEEMKDMYNSLKENVAENDIQVEIPEIDNSLANNEKMIQRNSNQELSGENLLKLRDFSNYKKNLKAFKDVNSKFTITTGIVTVAAWGVAAFYWWTWNFASAAATTLQALTLTVSLGFSIDAQVKAENDYNYINKLYPNSLGKDVENSIQYLSQKYSQEEIINMPFQDLVDSAILLSEIWLNMKTKPIIDKLLDYILLKGPSKVADFITRINILHQVKMANKKIVKATEWANKISKVINIIDSLISISSYLTMKTIFK
ncbi:MAG: hypothetical protein ACRCVI_01740 [Mycoplasmoidaceae bacterium]